MKHNKRPRPRFTTPSVVVRGEELGESKERVTTLYIPYGKLLARPVRVGERWGYKCTLCGMPPYTFEDRKTAEGQVARHMLRSH